MSGIDNNTLLYLRGDSFKDLSLNPKAITNSSSTIKDNCYYINGFQQRVHFGNLTLSGDFTIETMIYMGQYGYQFSTPILTPGTNESTKHWLAIKNGTTAGNYVAKKIYFGTHGAQTGIIGSASIVTLNAWHHIALVRNNNSLMLFLDGVKEATVTYSNTIDVPSACFGSYVTAEYAIDTKFYNYRISNVARYTENFTPPTKPYNAITIENLKIENNVLSCEVKGTTNEVIDKVDILINNEIAYTMTSGFENIYEEVNEKLIYGDNSIEVRAYFYGYNTHYENSTYSYYKDVNLEEFEPIPELLNSASLKDLMKHLMKIDNANQAILNNLKTILEAKGFSIESPRLSTMVKLVKELDNNNSAEVTEYLNRIADLEDNINNNKRILCTALINKNIPCSEEDSFETLVSYINSFEPYSSKVYLYNNGDMCTSAAGGWVFCTSGRPVDNTGYTFYAPVINSNYIYMGEKTSNTFGLSQMKTKNAIDVTNYNSLNVDATLISAYNDGYGACSTYVEVCTGSPNLTYWNFDNDTGTTRIKSLENTSTTPGRRTITLDVSSITGNVYVLIKVWALWSTAQYREEHIHRIWLE